MESEKDGVILCYICAILAGFGRRVVETVSPEAVGSKMRTLNWGGRTKID